MNEHKEIILEALYDYKQWFTDLNGSEQELLDDAAKTEVINNAIKFVEGL